MSCNGCRVLRKEGCMDDCIIRPCLEWIKNSESQANATFFLAKFYGRAGLLNLISSGPSTLRPDIFRSLLYEACGRVVNPVHGAVGLMWSGNWHLCERAVQAVLDGAPVDHVPSDLVAYVTPPPPLRDYDIGYTARPAKGRARVKRSHQVMDTTIREDRQCLMLSVETGEASHTSQAGAGASDANAIEAAAAEAEAEVDLTLSLMPPTK